LLHSFARVPARYRSRRPQHSVLYRRVQQHLETWLAHCREGHDGDGPVPEYVERQFRRYRDCGILARGFARAYCDACGHDFLIAFSCQGRGVCPSWNARRMVATAAHLLRMPLAVKVSEAPDPVDVRLLGAQAVVLESDPVPNAVEQTMIRRMIHFSSPYRLHH